MSRGVVGVLIGVLVIGAVAAGCGGSDDSSLSTAEFRKQANAICAQGEGEKDKGIEGALQKGSKKGASQKEFQEELVTDVALPPVLKMTEELGELGAPSGEEEKVEAMVDAFEAEIEKLEANPASVVSGSGGSFEKANKLAGELGLQSCSSI